MGKGSTASCILKIGITELILQFYTLVA